MEVDTGQFQALVTAVTEIGDDVATIRRALEDAARRAGGLPVPAAPALRRRPDYLRAVRDE
jgi:hypothetical protein